MRHSVILICLLLVISCSSFAQGWEEGKVYHADELYIVTKEGDTVNHRDVNGMKQGRFLQWKSYSYKEGEYMWKERYYVDDVMHGKAREWREWGVVHRQFNYDNGKINGLFKSYSASGKISEEISMVDDMKHGLKKTYFSGGKRLWSVARYDNGFWTTDTVYYRYLGVRFLRTNPDKVSKSTYHEWTYDWFHFTKRSREYVDGKVSVVKNYLFGIKLREKQFDISE